MPLQYTTLTFCIHWCLMLKDEDVMIREYFMEMSTPSYHTLSSPGQLLKHAHYHSEGAPGILGKSENWREKETQITSLHCLQIHKLHRERFCQGIVWSLEDFEFNNFLYILLNWTQNTTKYEHTKKRFSYPNFIW